MQLELLEDVPVAQLLQLLVLVVVGLHVLQAFCRHGDLEGVVEQRVAADLEFEGMRLKTKRPSYLSVIEERQKSPPQASISAFFTDAFSCCVARRHDDDLKKAIVPKDTGCCAAAWSRPDLPQDEMLAAKELRQRLVDLLGPIEGAAGDMDAWKSIESYGGEVCCCLRFLRARKQDVEAAEKMLRKTIALRKAEKINSILTDRAFLQVWTKWRPLWPAECPVVTKDKSPVLFFKLAHLLRFWQLDVPEEQLRMFYLSWMERTLRQQREGHVPGSEAMPACFEVYDLQGVGFSHARCLSGLRRFARILKIGQDNYPENLRQAILINVPSTAFAAAWPVLKRALDVRTLEKIKATDGDGHALLAEALGISKAQVCEMVTSVVPYVPGREVQSVVGHSGLPLFQ
mmetsp:Transcript_14927/g.34021  ORF Transcript_14927/g.34021 Transcript_14927/m.34021 type:complete len:401 (+) Transcript_14927:194-1396(+)